MKSLIAAKACSPIHAVRAVLMMLLLVLAGCAGGLSQSDKQTLSVVKPHDVDFEEIEYYALRSKSAYDEPSEIRKAYPNLTRVTTVQSVDVRYFIETNKSARTQTLSIRGTSDAPNIWQDIEITLKKDSLLGLRFHGGFIEDAQTVFQDVKPYLRKDMDIRVTGHSLGAAIAVLIAAYLEVDGYRVSRVVNFGQPKVTADEPKRILGGVLTRVVHDNDVMPMLPPPGFVPVYHHLGPELILRPGKDYAFLDWHDAKRISVEDFRREFSNFSVEDHGIKNYLANIQGKINGGAKQVPYLEPGQ